MTTGKPQPPRANCKAKADRYGESTLGFIADGPGTELTAIFNGLGVSRLEGCQCQSRSNQMNAWGVAGCREHFDEIVAWLREGQENFGWRDKLAAAARAVTRGLALKVNWADPFPGLVKLAIERAEEKAKQTP